MAWSYYQGHTPDRFSACAVIIQYELDECCGNVAKLPGKASMSLECMLKPGTFLGQVISECTIIINAVAAVQYY